MWVFSLLLLTLSSSLCNSQISEQNHQNIGGMDYQDPAVFWQSVLHISQASEAKKVIKTLTEEFKLQQVKLIQVTESLECLKAEVTNSIEIIKKEVIEQVRQEMREQFENLTAGTAGDDCHWSQYKQWSECSQSCDGGKQERTREGHSHTGWDCTGEMTRDTRSCNMVLCIDLTTTTTTTTTSTTTSTATTSTTTTTTTTTTTSTTTSSTPTTTSKPLPGVCNSYTQLDDPTRSVSHKGDELYCDQLHNRPAGRARSPDWAGTGWYRFTGGTYNTIPDKPPGNKNNCGSHGGGWLTETHPSEVGVEKSGQVCFDYNGNTCLHKKTVKMINCGNYFVYYLPDTGSCSHRYCNGKRG